MSNNDVSKWIHNDNNGTYNDETYRNMTVLISNIITTSMTNIIDIT